MDSFKEHFSYLFNNTFEDQSDDEGSSRGTALYLMSNDTSYDFCGSPDPTASLHNSKSCGSGNGADSASVIVSIIHKGAISGREGYKVRREREESSHSNRDETLYL